jgi:phage tail-like protein
MSAYLPPVGFHFKVEVLGVTPNDNDVRFTDVSGLDLELTTEEVAEGGQNRFLQKYPVRSKQSELVLKRGFIQQSEIIKWVKACLEDFAITPKNIDVKLLNEEHQPLVTWHLVNAYPTKWSVSEFSAKNNAYVVETLQVFYQYFTVDKET